MIFSVTRPARFHDPGTGGATWLGVEQAIFIGTLSRGALDRAEAPNRSLAAPAVKKRRQSREKANFTVRARAKCLVPGALACSRPGLTKAWLGAPDAPGAGAGQRPHTCAPQRDADRQNLNIRLVIHNLEFHNLGELSMFVYRFQ